MRPFHMLLAVLVAVVWGVAFVVSKIGLESFTPPQLTALRFLVAAAGVLWLPRPAVSWKAVVFIGFTVFTGQFLLQFFGIAFGMPAGLTAFVVQSQALFTVVFAALMFGDRPSSQQIIGMSVALVGLFVIGLTLSGGVPALAFGVIVLFVRIDTVSLRSLIWRGLSDRRPTRRMSNSARPRAAL
ncbi:hypothetical protein APR50_09930 [Variovorax paradoxus]|jgi:O-acetylserine/cysteine efflux transporter|uniref:EamA family transporter n=1 Tax=Variovorax paradoxus TaxID=34073 RepID=UPI0006E4E101|nr:hypothetical protein APR52_17340 [Variovorax paradoxus]KPV06450.1 hypothetical protein APR49_19735 [Variovorax paradoxus]KPV09059.1 hypothetical protein APR50_09930 [Variovorax paradoxus]KPV33926.1 hypothetical protein APR48_09085 [Variovorax paradoxus]KPV37268.1 hypothetical protein APR47_08480 [Variovorax paradoxus]